MNVSGVNFTSREISEDGNTFMVTVPIGEISVLNSPPEYTEKELRNIINDLNQTLTTEIHLERKSWTSPRGTLYRIMDFSVASNNDPLTWIELLMKFSGLSVKEITYDINSSTWTYKGEIYEL